jgi:TolB-like protein/DNA-binding winged helix-turn-helix (wHTH) protein
MRPVKSLEYSVIQIGAWRVDPALDEISRDGQTTKLERKMMQLLLCLAARAGQVVSVDQLLDEVWKDVVVTPDSVYHAVAALRRALGDNSKDPSYIANVMRRGYRLIAPVVPLDIAETPALPLQPPHFAAESQAEKPALEVPRSRSVRKLTGRRLAITTVTLVAMACAYLIFHRVWIPKRFTATQPAAFAAKHIAQPATAASAVAFAPPPHSIAVLPFVNISGNKDQEYFSDGLTEEILSSLARINELQVAARTSSFYFKGEHADLATIAHKLNVASVLEGSVRRSGQTVRVTAQLNNAVTGYHLWSQTYDRDLGDVLKMQSDIANAVANALRVTLLGDVAAKIAVGRTGNPAALDAYLRASNAYWTAQNKQEEERAISGYTEVIRLDPDYALAYADRSFALTDFAGNYAQGPELRDSLERAQADAHKAISLAPDLADGHLALGFVFESIVDYPRASEEYERALTLAPGNAKLLSIYGQFAVRMGNTDAGLAATRHSVVLDPLNPWYRNWLGGSLYNARRYGEAIVAYREAKMLAPNDANANAHANEWLGYAYYAIGDFQSARAACEGADKDAQPFCFALAYNKLGQHAAAKTMLGKLQASPFGAAHPMLAAAIYSQWGDTVRALDALEKAMRLRDPFLVSVKTGDLLDPLRKEPRFQAIERALKFPN